MNIDEIIKEWEHHLKKLKSEQEANKETDTDHQKDLSSNNIVLVSAFIADLRSTKQFYDL